MRYRRPYRLPELDRNVQHARLKMLIEAKLNRPLEADERIPGCGCARCTGDDGPEPDRAA